MQLKQARLSLLSCYISCLRFEIKTVMKITCDLLKCICRVSVHRRLVLLITSGNINCEWSYYGVKLYRFILFGISKCGCWPYILTGDRINGVFL